MEVSMANNKSKKAAKKSSNKSKTATAKVEKAKEAESVKSEVKEVQTETTKPVEKVEAKKPVEKTETKETQKEEEKTVLTKTANTNPFKGFFAKKCDPNENILTIFKKPTIWGAILGEVIGTMLLSVLMLTLGIYQPLYVMFGVLAITMGVYAFSGAHLNPIVTAGMMATRRVSAVRGIFYIVAQIVGAWLGLMLVSAFHGAAGESAAELPVMAELTNDNIRHAIFIELVGAIIIGFFFIRAQVYRTARGAFTYAAVVAGGVMLAVLFGIVVSGNFFGLQNNFIMNPALAIMYQIFPTSGEDFGALFGSIALAAATYIIVPMVGGILGSFLSDASSKLSGEVINK